MKKSVILTLIMLCSIMLLVACSGDIILKNKELNSSKRIDYLSAPKCYYWALGEKQELVIDSSKYFVCADLKKNATNDRREVLNSLIRDSIMVPYQCDDEIKELFTKESGIIKGIIKSDCVDLNIDFRYKSHFYADAAGNSVGMTDEVLVKVKDPDDMSALYEFMSKYSLVMLDSPSQSWYVLQCSSDKYGSSLDIANVMYESGSFDEAYPNLLVQLQKCTVDPYYSMQWGLNNVDNPEYDIDYESAMLHPLPYFNAITVAVVDDGITTTHPELNLLTNSYNAHLGQVIASVSPGIHGTMVAGVIGARANNNIGIAGVIPGVKLLSISFRFRSDYPDDYTSSRVIANGVKYAYENGASVINCSFDAYQVDPLVFEEYNKAMNIGRGGRGCILVFAAGNNNEEISNTYAINLSDAIVVGGINHNGMKSIYSSYGEHLDIVAPGANIWTTTVNGGIDYSAGTSLAAPYVSGVAALILARNPTLSREQVVDIIYSSAKKLSQYSFTTSMYRPYSWNYYVGYGLVDANAALNITPAP